MKYVLALAACGLIGVSGMMSSHGLASQHDLSGDFMRIRIVVGGQVLPATLENTAAAKAFADMLPLDLTLDDYHSIEKVSDLPETLPTQGSPAGIDPDVGDITYYAPWGNLAIFYRDFGYASGLVRLGRIEGSMAALSVTGALSARIELADAVD